MKDPMLNGKSNIVLIGMPGAGKSTAGVVLAKHSRRDFVDTDILIQLAEKRTLQQIIDAEGYLALRRIEERVLVGLNLRNHVIATGGSAAYSEPAMLRLKEDGLVVFLDVALDELRRRITDYENRGVARRPDQSFEDLFAERRGLYRKYADTILDCGTWTTEQVSRHVLELLGEVS
jgi:shikimate kinase